MQKPVAVNPRKMPRQRRSRAAYEAILTAAAEILEQGGTAALNTNLVAERAGVSIGSLYQYFPNKEAIAAELVRRLRADMRAEILSAIEDSEGMTLREATRFILTALIRHHARAPKLAHVLEQLETTLPMDGETRQTKALIHAQLTSVFAFHYVADPETVARDLLAMTAALAHAATRAGETDIDAITERCFRAVAGYLDLPPENDEDDLSRARP